MRNIEKEGSKYINFLANHYVCVYIVNIFASFFLNIYIHKKELVYRDCLDNSCQGWIMFSWGKSHEQKCYLEWISYIIKRGYAN